MSASDMGSDGSADAAQAPVTATWRKAESRDIARLHDRYLRPAAEPFFIEISGPDLGMPLAAFVEWCQTDAVMMVEGVSESILGFLWFSYIQPTIGVANVDWTFFSGHPQPRSRQMHEFRIAFDSACVELKLRKTHLLALPHQVERVRTAKQMGFVPEGVLQSHFFHNGRLEDVHCFGRSTP